MRKIPDFDGYKIDENGNVYSLFINRIMKVKESKSGYKSVGLRKNGRYYWFNCHRLVLMSFKQIPKNSNELQACHIDGDRNNNHISNLRWDSPKNNTFDKYGHGTMFNNPKGQDHPGSKLTNDIVIELRKKAATTDCKELSNQFGIPKLTVYCAVTGRTWKIINAIQPPVDLKGRQYKRQAAMPC